MGGFYINTGVLEFKVLTRTHAISVAGRRLL